MKENEHMSSHVNGGSWYLSGSDLCPLCPYVDQCVVCDSSVTQV